MNETTIITIEQLTLDHARNYYGLAETVRSLNEAIESLKRARMQTIKRRAAMAAASWVALENAITGNPHLFVAPRTLAMHGFKVGLRKGSGTISWQDSDKVCALIERHLPEQQDNLIRIKKSPIKGALAALPVDMLKRIGCSVEDVGDVAVIKPLDSEVEKIVEALLKDSADETE